MQVEVNVECLVDTTVARKCPITRAGGQGGGGALMARRPGGARRSGSAGPTDRIANRSGGSRSTASPSIPAWTGSGALTTRRGALHACPGGRGLSPGTSTTTIPSYPPPSVGRGAADQRAIKRVGVVRHENDDEITMLAPPGRRPGPAQAPPRSGPSPRLRSQDSTHLGIAAGWPANRITVDPHRGVVHKRAARSPRPCRSRARPHR